MSSVDCIIVGAGPAGIAAALQATRQGMSVSIFEMAAPGGQARAATLIENFPGFPMGISGNDLIERMLKQVEAHGISIIAERVVGARYCDNRFIVSTDKAAHEGLTLIIAVGLSPKKLGIPGEDELLGRKIFAYPDPSTVEHSNKRVCVIGSGDAAFDLAIGFSERALAVDMLMRGESPKCIPLLKRRALEGGICIHSGAEPVSFKEVKGSVAIEIAAENGRSTIDSDIVIVCAGKEQRTAFLAPPLLKGDVPGLFFAGDCQNGRHRHIAIAAGGGTLAAMQAADYLKR